MSNANNTRENIAEILLRRRSAITSSVKEEKVVLSPENLAKFVANLADLGYYVNVLNKNNKDDLLTLSLEDIRVFLDVANQVNKYKTKTTPLYNNFPSGVENTPEVMLYLDAIYYALSGFKETLFEESEEYQRKMEEYESNNGLKELVVLSGTDSMLEEILSNLLHSSTAPSYTDKQDMRFLIGYLADNNALTSLNIADIAFRETRVLVMEMALENQNVLEVLQSGDSPCTTTDILRFLEYIACDRCDLEKRFPLPRKGALRKLSSFITDMLEMSNAKNGHYDDIKRYKEEWKYILRNIEKTPLVVDIEDHLYGNNGKKIVTWLGKEQEMWLKVKDADAKGHVPETLFNSYLNILKDRKGELIRRADRILMLENCVFTEFLQELSAAIIEGDIKLGIQLYNYLLRRDKVRLCSFGVDSRVLDLKDEYPNADIEDIINLVRLSLVKNLENKLEAEHEEPVRMLYDKDAFKSVVIPTSNRNTSKNYQGLMSGTRISIEGKDYLRLFTKWEGEQFTDIDLAAIAIKGIDHTTEELLEDQTLMGNMTCAYYNLKALGMVHSGDVRNKNGEEYIDIDVNKLKEAGYDGILVRNTHFTGAFMPEIITGLMTLEKENSQKGEIFKDKDVLFSSKCLSDASAVLSFFLDLNTMEIVWVDKPSNEGVFSAYDARIENKIKNIAMVQQEFAKKLTLDDIVAPLIEYKKIEVISPEDYNEMSDEEKEDVLDIVRKHGDLYFTKQDVLMNFLGL